MASPNISFEQLHSSIRKPGYYFEYNTKLAVRTLPANPQRVLVLGQMSEGASAEPLTAIQFYDDQEAGLLFGFGSPAHRMAKAAIRANRFVDISAIGLPDEGAAIKASATISIGGTVTTSGIVTVSVGNERINAPALQGDDAFSVAQAVAEMIKLEVELPITAQAQAGAGDAPATVTLTAKHPGASGNLIPIGVANSCAGLVITHTVMSGGQLDSKLTAALDAVFAGDYQVFISQYATQEALTQLREHLQAVSGPLEQRGGRGFAVSTASLAAATTLAGQINEGRASLALLPGSSSLPWEIAAAYGAVVASEEDPARPLNGLNLTGIAVPPVESRLGRTEQETALKNGVTPLEVGPGEVVQIVRAISTYTKNSTGVDDVSLLDITTIATLDYVRKAVRERMALRFPREKLSNRTPDKVRSEALDVLFKIEELEIIEEVEANKDGVIVERDSQDNNRLNLRIPADVVNGLHVLAGRIDLLL